MPTESLQEAHQEALSLLGGGVLVTRVLYGLTVQILAVIARRGEIASR